MSDEQPSSGSLTSDDGCQFPAGPDGLVCGERIARSGAPGRPARYCENPDHTRAKAFAARRAFERVAAGGPAVEVELGVPGRPVTDGRSAFGALLARFEEAVQQAQRAAGEQQAQLAAILQRATEVVRTVSDPDAAGYEVEQIQRAASVMVAQAQTAQAAAERDAREARNKAEREAELRAQAEEAAEEALRELDAGRAEMAEAIARITAETQTTVAGHQQRAEQACEELARVHAEAAEAVTAARTEAQAHQRRTLAERDRILAEREAGMRGQIEQAEAAAAEQVVTARAGAQEQVQTAQRTVEEAHAKLRAAQQEAADAISARTRADAEKDAADRAARRDQATTERLREELVEVRQQHREDMAAVRADLTQERAAIATERTTHTEQLAALLATVQQATGHTKDRER